MVIKFFVLQYKKYTCLYLVDMLKLLKLTFHCKRKKPQKVTSHQSCCVNSLTLLTSAVNCRNNTTPHESHCDLACMICPTEYTEMKHSDPRLVVNLNLQPLVRTRLLNTHTSF